MEYATKYLVARNKILDKSQLKSQSYISNTGIFTYGMKRGYQDLISVKVMTDGKLLMQHHKN